MEGGAHQTGAVPDPVDPFALDGVDELFTLEPAAFTAARNALAKALRTGGDKAGSAAVATLRRPSATAWALNQVARTDPDLVHDALEAGAELRAATDAALAGDRAGLRSASAEDRAASAALVRAALDLLHGGAPGAEAKLAATVRAAVLDDDVADDLRHGILQVDHDRSGLGLGAELDAWVAPTKRHLHVVPDPDLEPEPEPTTPAAAGGPPGRGRSLKERRAAEKAAKERAAEAAAEQARLDAERRALRRQVNELRTAARNAGKRAQRLEREAAQAEATAAEARDLADEAAAQAEEAADALASAEARLDG